MQGVQTDMCLMSRTLYVFFVATFFTRAGSGSLRTPDCRNQEETPDSALPPKVSMSKRAPVLRKGRFPLIGIGYQRRGVGREF